MAALLQNPLASHLEYRNLGAELEIISLFPLFSQAGISVSSEFLDLAAFMIEFSPNELGVPIPSRYIASASIPIKYE